MHEFVITVACMAHLNCPIPKGVEVVYKFNNIQECRQIAQELLRSFDPRELNVRVACREK